MVLTLAVTPSPTSTTAPFSPRASTSLRRIASGIALALLARPHGALRALLARVADVRQQRELARTLDGRRELVLVPTAGAADAPRTELAALGDEAPQRADVLVVDLLDLVLAVRAGLATAAAGPALLVAPARRLACALLGHFWEFLRQASLTVQRAPAGARRRTLCHVCAGDPRPASASARVSRRLRRWAPGRRGQQADR